MTVSRYLTAQKLSLLVLVDLYCNSALPSAAVIPVLSFILSHAIPPTSTSTRARRPQEQFKADFPIEAFEDVLQAHPSSMPGRTLLDVFLRHMWDIKSFDALHDLFSNLGELLAKPKGDTDQIEATEHDPDQIYLSRTSPLGAFVRRARLEFTRLQFDDAVKLWAAFVTYRAPTAQWTRRLAGVAWYGFDENIGKLGLSPGDDLYEMAYGHLAEEEDRAIISMDDFDHLLEFQLDRLQRASSFPWQLHVLMGHRPRL
jgi:anaphase-promoting complex subunit 5